MGGNPDALWEVEGSSICVIHNWMLLLVKDFYFYEKIENFASYTTKKPPCTQTKCTESTQRGGKGRNKYSNATGS